MSPILLVRPTFVPPQIATALDSLEPSTLVIAGGTGAVSDAVSRRLGTLTGAEVVRLAGADRYETAGAVADYAVGAGLGTWHVVGIATGQNFPDGLCGGAGIGEANGVILLTRSTELAPATRQRLRTAGPTLLEVQVFGGTGAVSAGVWNEILALVR